VDAIVGNGIGVGEAEGVTVGSVVEVGETGDGVEVRDCAVGVSGVEGEAHAANKQSIKIRDVCR